MTHAKPLLSAVLIAGLTAACSGGGSNNTGAAGTGAAGTGAAGTGAAGTGALLTPTELVSAPGCGSINLVVVGTTLYWTEKDKGTVNSIPTAGGTATPLATGQMKPGPIAADATAVFWGNEGDKTLMKRPLPTGAAAELVPTAMFVSLATTNRLNAMEMVAAAGDPINALLLNAGTLYIGRGYYAFKVAAAGGALTQLATSPEADLGKPAAFAIDATHLYQTELEHLAISRQKLDGTQVGVSEGMPTKLAPDRIAVSQGSLATDAIAIAGGKVIWANSTNIVGKTVGQLETAQATNLANSAGFNSITGFVVSGDTIYLGEASDNNIEKTPLAPVGATPEAVVIAKNQMSPSQFAADATNIYWRTADCKIMKVAK